jgi:hypothetical protein
MPKNIFDLVSAALIATYYIENPSNKIPTLGSLLFPNQKQVGLDLSWIKGHNGLPVSLAPAAFDAKAPLRDRIGVEKIETEMPFFREGFRIGEKERQELLKVLGGANRSIVEPIIQKIYNDAQNLIDGADVVAERMRMQLLSKGGIQIVGDDGNGYNYNYKFSNKHKSRLTGTDRWSNTKADVVEQITTWQDTIEDDTGNRPAKAICTRKTWKNLLRNETIRLDMNPVGGQNVILTDAMLKAYVLDKLNLQVSVYNKKYLPTQHSAAENFFPDDTFSLIPDGNLGNTYYGTTPEEADLMSGGTNAQVSIVNTGVAVKTIKEPDPVNTSTIVSAIMLPSFEAIDSVFIANV